MLITDEGTLKVNRWAYEEVPLAEQPHPEAKGRLAQRGSMRRVDKGLVTIPYHGYIRFYNSVPDEQGTRQWYEFSAKFTDGKLVGIERVTEGSLLYW